MKIITWDVEITSFNIFSRISQYMGDVGGDDCQIARFVAKNAPRNEIFHLQASLFSFPANTRIIIEPGYL